MAVRVWLGLACASALAGACGGGSDGGGDDEGGTTTGAPEEPPDGAQLGPIAELGVPFDPVSDFYAGPPTITPGGHPKLVARPNPNGSVDVAWLDTLAPRIVLTQIVPTDDGYENAWHVELPTIDRLGGYTRDDAGNRYVLTVIAEDELLTSTTPSGEQRDGIARLVKLSPGGDEQWRVDLRTDVGGDWPDPLVAPMSFGTGRIAFGGDAIAITCSCLTEFDPAVMSRHQRQCFFVVDADSGVQLDHVPGPGHSWEQRIVWDGTRFVALVHGDAGLRGIGLVAYGSQPYAQRVAFAVKGGDPTTGGAYQNTFTRAGDVVVGDDGYALLFATENDPTYTGSAVIAARNLAFVHIRSDFDSPSTLADDPYDVRIVDTPTMNPDTVDFSVQIVDYWGGSYDGLNKGIAWLTDESDEEKANAESPKLVRLAGGEYVALWEQWTLSAPTGLWGLVIDEFGNVVTPAQSLGPGRIYRGDDAFALGDRAAWVVGDATVPQLVLTTVDVDLALERHALP